MKKNKLKWEVPKLVDLRKSVNGAIVDCYGGSAAEGKCDVGGQATAYCTGGGSVF